MTTKFWITARPFLLTLAASGLLACGSGGTPGGTGGNGPATSSAAGNQTGGTSGGGATSAGGGSSGAAGTSGTVSTDGKLCPGPTQALITDFTYTSGDTTQVHFGDSSTLAGGEYVYPSGTASYPLTSDMSASNWHITGNVGTYSGFGLYLDTCTRIDASKYAGISFKISGIVNQGGGYVTLGVDTLDDSITAAWLNSHKISSTDADVTNPGRCNPPADASLNQYSQSACANPTATIPVNDTPTVQSIMWTDFAGGKPESDVKPSDIVSIHWFFPNPDGISSGTATPYNVDITIDDLSFVSQ